MRKYEKMRIIFLAGPCLLFLIIFFLSPIALLFSLGFFQGGAFTLRSFFTFFLNYHGIFIKTLMIGLIVSVITLGMAYPVAWFIAKSRRLQGLLLVLVISPILVSIVIQSFGWMIVLGREGVVNSLLLSLGLINEPLPLLYNFNGIVIGLIQTLLPFMVLSLTATLVNIDPTLIEAAQNLGADRVRTFVTIIFPQSLPGILAGCSIVLTSTLAVFVVPSLLGGAEMVLSTLVVNNVLFFSDWTTASTTGLIMMVTSFIIVLIFTLLITRTKYRGVFQ